MKNGQKKIITVLEEIITWDGKTKWKQTFELLSVILIDLLSLGLPERINQMHSICRTYSIMWKATQDSTFSDIEANMTKLRLSYFGYIMRKQDSLEMTIMKEKVEGSSKRGRLNARQVDSLEESHRLEFTRTEQGY